MKKLALISVLILSFVCAWGLMSSDVSITVNGQEFHGPLNHDRRMGTDHCDDRHLVRCDRYGLCSGWRRVGHTGRTRRGRILSAGSRFPVSAAGIDPLAHRMGLLRGDTAQCTEPLESSEIPCHKGIFSGRRLTGEYRTVQFHRFQFARCGQIL